MKKRLFGLALMVITLAAVLTVGASAADNIASVTVNNETTNYTSLYDAFDAVAGTEEHTIELLASTNESSVMTVDSGETVVFNMNGYTITYTSSTYTSSGARPIDNDGTMTLNGKNGSIIATDAGVYGVFDNSGVAVLNDVTLTTTTSTANSANVRNFYDQNDATTYQPQITLNNVNVTSEDTSNSATYLVLNYDGIMTINSGTYTMAGGSASGGAYAVQSCSQSEITDATITGGKGALSVSSGIMTINSGTFTGKAYYGFYIAGEIYEASAKIYGGTFKSETYAAIHIGNDNTNGDGGINADASTVIFDGTFIGGGSTALSWGINTGSPYIMGGSYSSDVSDRVVEGYKCNYDNDTKMYEVTALPSVAEIDGEGYPSLEAAVLAAEDDDTITVLTDVALSAPVYIEKSITITGDADDKPYIAYASDHSYVFYITADDVTVEFTNLNVGVQYGFVNVNSDKGGVSEFGNTTVIIDNCVFTEVANSSYAQANYIVYEGTDGCNLTFTNNVMNGGFSKPIHTYLYENQELTVTGNAFNGRAQSTNNRSLTIIVKDDSVKVNISNNTFSMMQKAISVDNGTATGDWTIKENSFIDVGAAFDLSTTNEANKGYDLSYNYFATTSEPTGTELVVMQSSENESDTSYSESITIGSDSKLKLTEAGIIATELVMYPYYTNAAMTELYYGVASVTTSEGEVSYYGSLEAAVAAANDGATITIWEDVTLTADITIDKNLIITGATGTETISYTGTLFTINNDVDVTFDSLGLVVANTGIMVNEAGDGSTVIITNCTIASDTDGAAYIVRGDTGISDDTNDYHYNLVFTGNTVTGQFQKPIHAIIGTDNTVTITNNSFTGEYNNEIANKTANRSVTIIVEDSSAVVTITGNTFDNLYKAISIDSWLVAPTFTLTGNSFVNCEYSMDISSANDFNDKLSFAYNYFDGSLPVILDSNDNDTYDNSDNDSELVFYPYYADAALTSLVYEDTSTSTVENAVSNALDAVLSDTANTTTIAAAIEIISAVDTDYIAENEDLLEALNDLDAALIAAFDASDDSGSIEVSTEITPISKDEVITTEDIDTDDLITPTGDDVCAEAQGLAVSIIGNDDISDYASVTVGLTTNQIAASAIDTIDPDTEEVTETTIVVTYEITPFVQYGEDGTATAVETITNPVTFKLYLPAIFNNTNCVSISHDGGEAEIYTIYQDSGEDYSYAILTVTHFSEFVVTYEEMVSTSSSGSTNTGTIIYPDETSTSTTTTTDDDVEEETVTTVGGFNDVFEDDYYADAVEWAVENDITSGMTTTTFVPNNDCTREQVMTFLWRAMGEPDVELSNGFSDVVDGSYYADAVAWAIENGITNGMSDDLFGTGETATRGQIVTFLYRLAGEPEMAGDCDFTDVSTDGYYYAAVLWAVENGITDGMGDSTFAPDSPCTRAQIVTFLYRYFN